MTIASVNTGCFLSYVPIFCIKWKKNAKPTRNFVTLKIAWKSVTLICWLQLVFFILVQYEEQCNGGGWREVIHNVSLPAGKLSPASLPSLLKKGWYLPTCQVCGEEEGGEKNCKSQTQVDHLQSVGTISYIWKRGVWESWRTPTCNICGLLTWPKYSSCLSLTPCREEAVPRHADARQPRTKSSYKNIKICSVLTNFDG